LGADAPCSFPPVEDGQFQIKEDQVRNILSDQYERFFAVGGFADIKIPNFFEPVAKDSTIIFVVFDN